MGCWRHSMIGPDLARSRRLRQRRKLGWYRWLATKPRTTAIRMSCGRRDCSRSMHARTRLRPGTNVWPIWSRGRCARFSANKKLSRTKVRYYLEERDPEFDQKMAEVLCVYREVQVLKKAANKEP